MSGLCPSLVEPNTFKKTVIVQDTVLRRARELRRCHYVMKSLSRMLTEICDDRISTEIMQDEIYNYSRISNQYISIRLYVSIDCIEIFNLSPKFFMNTDDNQDDDPTPGGSSPVIIILAMYRDVSFVSSIIIDDGINALLNELTSNDVRCNIILLYTIGSIFFYPDERGNNEFSFDQISALQWVRSVICNGSNQYSAMDQIGVLQWIGLMAYASLQNY